MIQKRKTAECIKAKFIFLSGVTFLVLIEVRLSLNMIIIILFYQMDVSDNPHVLFPRPKLAAQY